MRSVIFTPRNMESAFKWLLFSFWAGPLVMTTGQGNVWLGNPSFESKPRIGIDDRTAAITGWTDCGLVDFPGTSPPDIHPLPDHPWYDAGPVAGDTYLGLVCRSNRTWESVSQTLSSPLLAGACYRFSCSLITLPKILVDLMDSPRAAVLRIWGGSAPCAREELLGQSPGIAHSDWREYTFHLRPAKSWPALTLEAWYSMGDADPHSGHLLVDAASGLMRTDAATAPRGLVATMEMSSRADRGPGTFDRKSAFDEPVAGQRFRMESLHFAMDSAALPAGSSTELESLYRYLQDHPAMTIEIGGHTNTVPPDAYCDALSLARAEAVRNWLVDRGVLPGRIQVKGYGKREPMIRYDPYSRTGRLRNQRVEIRVLSF